MSSRTEDLKFSGSASPVEFISLNPSTGKFSVNDQALSVLKKIPGPVACVAVCGRARQGKSFLLNQIVRKLKHQQQSRAGFAVSPYHKPCTKGLWLWSEPIPLPNTLHNGCKCHVVLMDCEGIDAYDQSHQYSTQIFSLAVLLSSLFVFNQMGGIDEAALERLSMVSELSRVIYSKAGGQGSADAQEFAPSFLWLLRDFHLQIREDGREMTPHDYLEETLQLLPGADEHVQGRNQIRESIRSVFPQRDCFALVRPINDEELLAKMDTLPPAQLRQPFREGLDNLVNVIIGRAKPKRCFGTVANGMALAGLTEAFVKAINAGAVPEIASAWQYVMRSECQRAVGLAKEYYLHSFNQDVPVEEAAFTMEHVRALQEATEVFLKEASLATPDEQDDYLKQLRTTTELHMQAVRRERLALAAASVTQMLSTATGKFSHLFHSADALQPTHLSALEEQVKEFLTMYQASAAGPTKYPQLLEFMQASVLPGMKELVARAAAQAVKAAQEAQVKAEYLATLEEQHRALQLQLQLSVQKNESTEKELTNSKLEQNRLQSELQGLRREKEQLQADLAKATAAGTAFMQQVEANKSACEQLMKQVAHMQQELMDSKVSVSQLTAERDQMAEAKAQAAADARAQGQQVAALTKDLSKTRAELAVAQADQQYLREQLAQQCKAGAQAQETLQQLQQELEQARSQHQSTLTSANKTQLDLASMQHQLISLSAKEKETQQLADRLQQQLTSISHKEKEAQQLAESLQQRLTTISQKEREAQQLAGSLQQQLASVSQKEREAQQLAGSLQQQLAQAQEARDLTAALLQTVETDAGQLRTRLADTTARGSQLSVDVAAARAESDQLRAQLDSQKADAASLQQQLQHAEQTLQEALQQKSKLEEDVAAQAQQLEESKDTLAAILREKERLEQDIAARAQELKERGEALAAAQWEREKLEEIVASRMTQLEESKGTLAMALQERARLEQDVAAGMQRLKESKEILTKTLEEQQQLKGQVAVLQQVLRDREQAAELVLVEKKRLEEQVALQQQVLREREQAAESALQKAKQLEEQLTAQRNTAEADLAAARFELASTKADLTGQLSEAQAAAAALQQCVDESQAELADLQQERERLAAAAEEAAALHTQLAASDGTLASVTAERDELKDRQRDLEVQLGSLRTTIDLAQRLSPGLQSIPQSSPANLPGTQNLRAENLSHSSPAGTTAAVLSSDPRHGSPYAAGATGSSPYSAGPIANISPVAPAGDVGPAMVEKLAGEKMASEEDGSPSAPPVPEPAGSGLGRVGKENRKRVREAGKDEDSGDLEPEAKRGAGGRPTPTTTHASALQQYAGTPIGALALPSSPYNTPVANPESMTIQDIKQWLTVNGHEESLWELNSKKPRKADWVKLIKEKSGQA